MAKIENKVKGLRTIPVQEFLALEFNQLKDSKRNVTKLVNAIKKNGWSFPVFVWNNFVIDGTGRKLALEALVKEGFEIEEIPVVDIEAKNLQEAKQKALEVSSQYGDITKDSFLFFAEDLELDFDTFNIGGIDKDILITPDEKDDEVPEVPEKPKSKLGDLYELGEHRILCGDSTKLEDVERLMDGKKADMVFTDPPYGVDYDGGATSKRVKLVGDEKETSIYAEVLPLLYAFSVDSAPFYIWHAAGYADMASEMQNADLTIRSQIIWNKNQAQFGALSAQYKQKHEPCFYAHKKGKAPTWNGPTNEVTVWDVERGKKNEFHPTQKPVALSERAILNHIGIESSVLDLFLGSGSTLIAAEKTGRICYSMELDPKYVDVAVQRYVDYVEEPIVKLNGKVISWQKSK